MSSLFTALNISLSGLQTATTQMLITSNNIANAGTEGYTRKTAKSQAVTLGMEGGGTQIMGYMRATNDTLYTTLNTAISDAGLRNTQEDYLAQVQNILGSDNSSNPALSDAISKFSAAWQQLAAAPESNVNQTQVVQAATQLVSTVQTLAGNIDTLDRQCYTDVNNTLSDLNSNLASINDLNNKISMGLGTGMDISNLIDQRDLLVQKVCAVMDVTVMERANEQIALYTPGGYMLLDGAPQSFSYDGANVYANSDPALSLNNTLTGGKLQALVSFRAVTTPTSTDQATNVIQKLKSQLDAVVSAFTTVDAGPPESFAYAYANAASNAGEAAFILSGTDSSSFAVNSTLLDGTETIKLAGSAPVVDTFNDATKSFSADGLNVTNASYATLASSILTNFQQAATSIKTLSATASNQRDYLQERLTNDTGVNVDNEIVALTTLQNAYAASAHVMQIINQLFTTLENIL
ncbi:MAG: flagellar hook-associated protein FlgK [Alphaproteobacteria bacterium]|nr:flagellar hook-associated protein FlgK [Alphaproteobacteria bacterium]